MTERTLTLAFESSCDETSVAVIENGTKILSNIVATQIDSHQRFGGVVPEVASRHHIEQITKCTNEALEQADVDYNDLDAVAVTYGPGLVGSLLIGVTAAKVIAWAHNLPLVPVNHMAGHIYAARYVGEFKYPQMALLVSGGHTELVYMPSEHEYQIIGETRDDAAGEAYDKIGRVLGVNYLDPEPSGRGYLHHAHHCPALHAGDPVPEQRLSQQGGKALRGGKDLPSCRGSGPAGGTENAAAGHLRYQ